jgi:hypothetical protein
MDPLSIAFGVITLLELTKKIIIYAKQTKDAPADRTRVLQEASSLTGLLSTLKDFIEDCDDSEDPWLHATSSLTAQDGPLHQCRLTLESIVAKLTSIRGHGKIGLSCRLRCRLIIRPFYCFVSYVLCADRKEQCANSCDSY